MDKKTFDKITKEIFLAYGFIKKNRTFLLILDEITISCRLYTWNMITSFNYWISVNRAYDDSIPYDQRYGSIVATKIEHSPSAQGYKKSEIKYEEYTEEQYREMLTRMLHSCFDPYKEDAIQCVRDNHEMLTIKPEELAVLGIE